MSSTCHAAVVTGSNVGIGFEIVKKLCHQFDGDVYLTSIKEEDGEAAVKELQDFGLSPKLHQLDVTNTDSVNALKNTLLSNNGGLDILVNNAGIMYKPDSEVSFPEQATKTLQTNFWGVVNVCDALFPILRPHARIVNMSSLLGKKSFEECSQTLRTSFQDGNLTKEKLFEMMEQFVCDAEKGNAEVEGWSTHSYGISKLGVTLLTQIQQKDFDRDPSKDIIVNSTRSISKFNTIPMSVLGESLRLGLSPLPARSGYPDLAVPLYLNNTDSPIIFFSLSLQCTPGWVRTQMGGPDATKSPEEGADTPTFLALLPHTPDTEDPPQRGKFWKDRTVDEWW